MKKLLLTLFIATLVLTGCANNSEELEPTPTPTATTDTAKVSMKDKTFYIEAKDNLKLDDLIDLDDKDSKVEVQGDYDLSKAGTYKVKVVVTDKDGNKTEEEKTIVVDNKINIESLKKEEEANKPVEPETSKNQPTQTPKPQTDGNTTSKPKPTPTPAPEAPKLDTSDWRIALAYSYEGREGTCDTIAYQFYNEIFPEMANSTVSFTEVSASEARIGDNVAYTSTTGGVGHQAVYLGNGMALHGNYNGKAKVASVYGLAGLSEPEFGRPTFTPNENKPAPESGNEEDLVFPEDYYKDEASGFTPEMCAVPATQLANGSAALAFWCSDNYDHLIKWDE